MKSDSAPDDLRVVEIPAGHLHTARWRTAPNHAGNHPPIVLFHDSLGCNAMWRDFPRLLCLATNHDVIAYDRLGFGQSTPHPGQLGPHFIRDEADEGFRHLRQALCFDRFIAFGHSVGGGMAVGCAAAYPEHCVALITESAQAFIENQTLAGIRNARDRFSDADQYIRLHKYHGDKTDWVLAAWIESWLAPAFADWSLDGDLGKVRCPTLAIHGDRDEYGSSVHPQRIVDQVAGRSMLSILPDCGHVPHRERTAEVLSLISRWLSAID